MLASSKTGIFWATSYLDTENMEVDMANISRAAAIVGAAESDEMGYLENRKSDLQLHVEASYNALEDAGLKKSDVDAIFSSGNTLGWRSTWAYTQGSPTARPWAAPPL